MYNSAIKEILAYLQPCVATVQESNRVVLALARLEEEQRSEVLDYLYRNLKNNPQAKEHFYLLETSLRDTKTSAHEWIQSFYLVLEWLHREEKTARIDEVVGYLECCQEMNALSNVPLSLELSTSEALRSFGFHAAEKY